MSVKRFFSFMDQKIGNPVQDMNSRRTTLTENNIIRKEKNIVSHNIYFIKYHCFL